MFCRTLHAVSHLCPFSCKDCNMLLGGRHSLHAVPQDLLVAGVVVLQLAVAVPPRVPCAVPGSREAPRPTRGSSWLPARRWRTGVQTYDPSQQYIASDFPSAATPLPPECHLGSGPPAWPPTSPRPAGPGPAGGSSRGSWHAARPRSGPAPPAARPGRGDRAGAAAGPRPRPGRRRGGGSAGRARGRGAGARAGGCRGPATLCLLQRPLAAWPRTPVPRRRGSRSGSGTRRHVQGAGADCVDVGGRLWTVEGVLVGMGCGGGRMPADAIRAIRLDAGTAQVMCHACTTASMHHSSRLDLTSHAHQAHSRTRVPHLASTALTAHST